MILPMATERKRRRSSAPQRSPGELADTLAQMAASTQDPPPRRRARGFEVNPSRFTPSADPEQPRSPVVTAEPEPEQSAAPPEPKPQARPKPPPSAQPISPPPGSDAPTSLPAKPRVPRWVA